MYIYCWCNIANYSYNYTDHKLVLAIFFGPIQLADHSHSRSVACIQCEKSSYKRSLAQLESSLDEQIQPCLLSCCMYSEVNLQRLMCVHVISVSMKFLSYYGFPTGYFLVLVRHFPLQWYRWVDNYVNQQLVTILYAHRSYGKSVSVNDYKVYCQQPTVYNLASLY